MIEFLQSLWGHAPGAYGELRIIGGALRSDGTVLKEQFFFKIPDDLEHAVKTARFYDEQGRDVYFGTIPRVRAGDGKAENCLDETIVLWADLDNKNLGSHMSALLSLQQTLQPSILLDSGHGIHGYWLMRRPIPFSQAQAAMKGMAKLVGGDHVHDAPRILRLPGTHNYKHGERKPVRVLIFDPTRRYRWEDFEDYVEKPRLPAANRARLEDRVEFGNLPDDLKDLIEHGPDPGADRSGVIFGVVCRLIEFGWSEQEISDLFLDAETGIGAKLTEMSDRAAQRWMQRTISAAWESVSERG